MAAPQELVKDLETQLEALESSLQPLFATKSLDDYARTLQPMQEAKLDNMIAYLIHDLSWSA